MSMDYSLDDLLKEFSSAAEAAPEPLETPVVQPPQPPEEPQPAAQEEEGQEGYDDGYQDPDGHGYEEYREEYEEYYDEDEPGVDSPDEEDIPRRKGFFHEVLMGFAGLIFLCVSAIVLLWVGLNIHPDTGTATTVAGDSKLNLPGRLDVYMNNAASDALGDLVYIRKIYTIEESATVAPAPDPGKFGTTDDPAVIQALIDSAWELLGGQETIWRPDLDFVPGEPMRYYYDDTILVIQWKEYIDERCCTCAEVKLAHGSQIRRKLVEDTYGSAVQLYASEMSNAVNAVIAINGDYYTYRDFGITVYQRKLYRNNQGNLDSCFFTAGGDMLFTRAGELSKAGETEKFIKDNDVVFSVSFGPVLVDNGELQYCETYPIGEIDTQYSRSCIAQKGDLHYFLMTINHTPDTRPRATINKLAEYVHSKGVDKAYNLDGGQTSEIVMMGGPVNWVDYGNERTVSDIIYFATAIPSQEVVS